jgi:hypothetical protein
MRHAGRRYVINQIMSIVFFVYCRLTTLNRQHNVIGLLSVSYGEMGNLT